MKENQSILIKDLQELLSNKDKYKLSEEKGHFGVPDNGDGYQDEYNEKFIYYKHPGFPESIFMRETYHTDSYGYNYTLSKVEFLTGRAKQITIYEPI